MQIRLLALESKLEPQETPENNSGEHRRTGPGNTNSASEYSRAETSSRENVAKIRKFSPAESRKNHPTMCESHTKVSYG